MKEEIENMRFVVKYDGSLEKWLVTDALSVEQPIGLHRERSSAVIQAESEERQWRRFGPGTETFALVAF